MYVLLEQLSKALHILGVQTLLMLYSVIKFEDDYLKPHTRLGIKMIFAKRQQDNENISYDKCYTLAQDIGKPLVE